LVAAALVSAAWADFSACFAIVSIALSLPSRIRRVSKTSLRVSRTSHIVAIARATVPTLANKSHWKDHTGSIRTMTGGIGGGENCINGYYGKTPAI
jgi:hypothetical protein